MISLDEAWSRISERAAPLPTEVRDLDEATGFVLAEDLFAKIDLPPFANSAMDGYALRAGDTSEASPECPVALEVTGEIAAGSALDGSLQPGTAVQIMTGAPLPAGADSVLRLEDGRLRHGKVEIGAPVARGKHVRAAGEDAARGELLLERGAVLNPQRLGLAAGAGVPAAEVHRRPTVSMLATGSELAPPGESLKPGQIYDSNRPLLRQLVESMGLSCSDLGIAPDKADEIKARVQQGLEADILLISGGVSVGKHDHVKAVMQELGMETIFWRVKMKPGKPQLCGQIGDCWVFGLPGNPISAVVGFVVFIEPLIRRMSGEANVWPCTQRARLMRDVKRSGDRRLLMTARLERSDDGMLVAEPTEKQGSAMMHALAQSDGFIVVPEERESIEAGEVVDVFVI